MKTKTKIRLLVMSKVEREKRLDELNRKLGIDQKRSRNGSGLKGGWATGNTELDQYQNLVVGLNLASIP